MITVQSHKLMPANAGIKTALLLGMLCLSLLLGQGLDLTHSHDGDVQASFDCEICLKTGSLEDLTIGNDVNLASVIRTQLFEAAPLSLPFLALPSRNARAPPAHA